MSVDAPPADCRFPRTSRLLKPAQFKRALGGVRVSGRYFRFSAIARHGDAPGDGPRLGLAMAKRALKRAVDRNLAKRVVRESFRHRREQLGDVDVVVFANAAVRDAAPADLRRHLDRQWQQLTHKLRDAPRSGSDSRSPGS